MNRHIFIITALASILFLGLGCEKGQEKVVVSNAVTSAEPNKIELVKTAEPEPNLPQTQPVETPAVEPVEQPPVQPAEANKPPQLDPEVQLCEKSSQILRTYVNEQGWVNYRMLKRKKLELLDVLDAFRNFDRDRYNSMSKDDKLAFWINAYNLELIKIILDNYPIQSTRVLLLFYPANSIQHIKGLWDQNKFIVMNEEFTLQEIEQRFFKKEFNDPRTFFAIYYGTVSGPTLRNDAYCGPKLSEQLDEQVLSNLASGQIFRLDRQNKTVYISAILKHTWNGPYFIEKYGTDLKFKQQPPEMRAILNFLTHYLPALDVDFLETGNYSVDFMRYDWTLNELNGQ